MKLYRHCCCCRKDVHKSKYRTNRDRKCDRCHTKEEQIEERWRKKEPATKATRRRFWKKLDRFSERMGWISRSEYYTGKNVKDDYVRKCRRSCTDRHVRAVSIINTLKERMNEEMMDYFRDREEYKYTKWTYEYYAKLIIPNKKGGGWSDKTLPNHGGYQYSQKFCRWIISELRKIKEDRKSWTCRKVQYKRQQAQRKLNRKISGSESFFQALALTSTV